MNDHMLSEEHDRVRKHSAASVNRSIDRRTKNNLNSYAGRSEAEISARIKELNQEWGNERWLETNASTLALTGLILGVTVNKKWLIVPGIVLPFLFQNAVQGWCPPLPILRRLGIRTREEIDAEKFALKTVRGDFRGLSSNKDANAAFESTRT